eukprot:Transcript_10689.p2 GENE.Transcript_10689~~Transcript_10689.p2  ORF type:complete len:305 (+),score=158.16 Transcript_10689:71-916(+)
MFSRKNAYESTEQSKGLDDMSKKLAVDLRKHIKKLEMVPAYSKEWIAMTDTLLHISNIALMENRLPQDNKADSTLWEGDELTVRFMLEEGKLNLALRLMHEYKKAQAAELSKGEGSYAEFLASTAAAVELADAEQLKARLLVFEQSLGTLLRCSLEHVEAVQTTDLPELMQYAAEVLGRAAAADAAGHEWDRTQEVMLLRYLSSVMARVETLGEDRVMPQLKQHGLLAAVIGHLHTHHAALKQEGCADGAQFLADAMDTEDYATYTAMLEARAAPAPASHS